MPSVSRFDFLPLTTPSSILGLILKTSEDCCNADHKNRLLLSSVILLSKGVIVSLDKKKKESMSKKEGCFGWHERISEFPELSHIVPFQVLSISALIFS